MQVKLKHLRNFFFGLPPLYLAKTVCISRKDYLFTTDRLSNVQTCTKVDKDRRICIEAKGSKHTGHEIVRQMILSGFDILENDGGRRHPVDNKTNSSSLFVHFSPKRRTRSLFISFNPHVYDR